MIQLASETPTVRSETPGYPAYRIFADESGTNPKEPCYGFGLLWIPDSRRGDFHAAVRRIKADYGERLEHEVKWTKLTPSKLRLYKALVDFALRSPNIFFHAIIYPRELIDLTLHDGDWDLARRKHFVGFLRNRIRTFSQNSASRPRIFHVRVDPGYSRYGKATEAAGKILARGLAQDDRDPRGGKKVLSADLGNDVQIKNVVSTFLEADSAESQGIQLCDLLLGAILAARQGKVQAAHKKELMKHMAQRLGWNDLRCYTYPDEMRFNIWCWRPDPGEQLPGLEPRAISSSFVPKYIYTGRELQGR